MNAAVTESFTVSGIITPWYIGTEALVDRAMKNDDGFIQ